MTIQEDRTLYDYHCENFKSYDVFSFFNVFFLNIFEQRLAVKDPTYFRSWSVRNVVMHILCASYLLKYNSETDKPFIYIHKLNSRKAYWKCIYIFTYDAEYFSTNNSLHHNLYLEPHKSQSEDTAISRLSEIVETRSCLTFPCLFFCQNSNVKPRGRGRRILNEEQNTN
jgi:hypothetical protein